MRLPVPTNNLNAQDFRTALPGGFVFGNRCHVQGKIMNLKLLTKPECHLCAAARDTMDEVTAEYNVTWQEISTTDHPELAEQLAEKISVLLVDERQRHICVI